MPSNFAAGLYVAGTLFGVLAVATASRRIAPRRDALRTALVSALLLLGGVLLLGTVAGVYRPCPLCLAIWGLAAVLVLTKIGDGHRSARPILLLLGTLTAGAAWTRADGVTASVIARSLPAVPLRSVCLDRVLTPADLAALRALGLPGDGEVAFVAQCSPCASASAKRLAEKRPDLLFVGADATLADVVGRKRLIVFPALRERGAALSANLYSLVLRDGAVTSCKSNIE